MKNSIKFAALFLLAATGLCAAVPAKASADDVPAGKAAVSVSSLASNKGITVKLNKEIAGRSVVMIYDQNKNVLRKDVLTSNGNMEKAYVLNKLDEGDYTLEVIANKQTVKKNIHVYDEGSVKTFIIME